MASLERLIEERSPRAASRPENEQPHGDDLSLEKTRQAMLL
jgi:hypothetical protein